MKIELEKKFDFLGVCLIRASLIAQLVKNPPTMQKTPVWFLSWESTGEGIGYPLQYSWVSLLAPLVKNLPAMWETWVRFLGREDPWRRESLPTPVFWSGKFHGLYSPWGHNWATFTCFYMLFGKWHHCTWGRCYGFHFTKQFSNHKY